MAAETAWFLTAGGAVYEMDLPLPEAQADRLTKGYLTRVANEAGDPYEEPTPASDDTPVVPKPDKTALKAEWVGYAVRVGGISPDDAEAMTKTDLIDRFGKD